MFTKMRSQKSKETKIKTKNPKVNQSPELAERARLRVAEIPSCTDSVRKKVFVEVLTVGTKPGPPKHTTHSVSTTPECVIILLGIDDATLCGNSLEEGRQAVSTDSSIEFVSYQHQVNKTKE